MMKEIFKNKCLLPILFAGAFFIFTPIGIYFGIDWLFWAGEVGFVVSMVWLGGPLFEGGEFE